MRRGIWAALPLYLACTPATDDAPPPPPDSGVVPSSMSWEASLLDSQGVEVGVASIRSVAHGLEVSVTLSGIPDGRHGFHIHENGECAAPDFASAGGHLNPSGMQHGMESATGPHAGDMPNVVVEGGTAR